MDPPSPTNSCTPKGFLGALDCGSGAALTGNNQTINTLLAAIAGSAASFGVQGLIFLLLRLRLSRIYRPRSYLVPERERVPAPPPGLVKWLVPLFTTPNLAFIQKCGLDAYFFLRYLRMLLKIFLPVALVVLPILLPLNRFSGNTGATHGLDRLSISNIEPAYRRNRLWAHLLLAIGVIAWFCYVIYKELRGYIRVRQAYLTSPQHRIRASATTVLVTGIPRKWLTLEALSGLYDVFPGGIRNIWINRNFDELSDKVKYRAKLAKNLEGAELDLIKKCRMKYDEAEKAKRKAEGAKKRSKGETKRDQEAEDAAAEMMAQGQGVSAGDQHQVAHGLQDVLHDAQESEEHQHEQEQRSKNPMALFGQGLEAVQDRFGALGQGFGALGKGVVGIGQKAVGGVDAGFHRAGDELDSNINAANSGAGFTTDDELYRQSIVSQSEGPTPPPKTPVNEREARFQDLRTSAQHAQAKSRPAHPLAAPAAIPGEYDDEASPLSETTLNAPDPRLTKHSVRAGPKDRMQIEEPEEHAGPRKSWQVWKNKDHSLAMPSPQPHTAEEDDEFPLNGNHTATQAAATPAAKDISPSKWAKKLTFWKKKKGGDEEAAPYSYASAINKDWDEDQDGSPRWRHYIEQKDRDTKRLPIIWPSWFPSLPFIGPKVDKIYWLRRELARMNLEIEEDQDDVEKFPYMNSAFIQFNHQVAAHMACQSLSHHVPQQMAPRLVEISPDDVLWDNMSIKWWERYMRTLVVLVICAALILLYAVPVTFTSLLSKVDTLADTYRWLSWLRTLPDVVISIIQGLLPPILLSIILILVPVIFRLLIKQQGVPTGNSMELGVQVWYFAFLFIQVFFVVTLSGGLTSFFQEAASNPGKVISSLSTSLPKAANYFFSYLLVQALSNSASALLQVGTLIGWFVLAPLFDSTPRAKWRRQTSLSNVQWGSFFPPFTNFAVIGIIYSVIAPFILVFMLIIFSLFWVVYRYNVLYVYQFRNDTGGLLFPTALNQLFVGIYFMELCLIGYFFISQDQHGNVACAPQGGIMIVVMIFTALFQWQLNAAFAPLFQYLPITLEDEAVIRDEEFSRAQASKFAPLTGEEGEGEGDYEQQLEDREKREQAADEAAEERDLARAEEHRQSTHGAGMTNTDRSATPLKAPSWQHSQAPSSPSWKTDRWRPAASSPGSPRPLKPREAITRLRRLQPRKHTGSGQPADSVVSTNPHVVVAQPQDEESQAPQHTVGDILFSGFADELEDLTPEERDLLVRYAFQHSALRAKRPVVWIPRDRLGVSDDEIRRAERMSTVVVDIRAEGEKAGKKEKKTFIWMSNEGTALDGKGRAVFRRSPPDFSNVDLIAL